eukprot:1160886-Pelagomonas_calceolata.AAC.6
MEGVPIWLVALRECLCPCNHNAFAHGEDHTSDKHFKSKQRQQNLTAPCWCGPELGGCPWSCWGNAAAAAVAAWAGVGGCGPPACVHAGSRGVASRHGVDLEVEPKVPQIGLSRAGGPQN